MERLTILNKKIFDNEEIKYYQINNNPNDNTINLHTAIEKLGQLEDLEESLGIDLITLFKVLKQNYIYLKEYYIWFDEVKITKNPIHGIGNINDNWVLFTNNYYDEEHMVYIKDYGTKWALRKEDLQNE